MNNKNSLVVNVGDIKIGGNHPVVIVIVQVCNCKPININILQFLTVYLEILSNQSSP